MWLVVRLCSSISTPLKQQVLRIVYFIRKNKKIRQCHKPKLPFSKIIDTGFNKSLNSDLTE